MPLSPAAPGFPNPAPAFFPNSINADGDSMSVGKALGSMSAPGTCQRGSFPFIQATAGFSTGRTAERFREGSAVSG